MDKQLYLFKIVLFNQRTDSTETMSGMLFGSSFADVVATLEKRYGPSLFGITYLSPCADTGNDIAECGYAFLEQAVKEWDPFVQP